MQTVRDLARQVLGRSLRSLAEEDRLAAALPVICGSAMAGHCEVVSLDEQRTLHVRVDAPEWLPTLLGMRERLRHDLARVAGVQIDGLHFEEAGKGAARLRPRRQDS